MPVGPAGIALSCADDDGERFEERPPLRLGATMTWSANGHLFGDGGELRRRALGLAATWRALEEITVSVRLGALVDGDLVLAGDRWELRPGIWGGLGLTWRAFAEEDWLPFVLLGAEIAAGSAITALGGHEERLTAFDFRTSLVIGKLFARRLGPYAAVRSLGGPLLWRVDGRDRTSKPEQLYQLGGGLMTTTGALDAYFEVMPLGERSLTVGAGYAF